LSPPSWINVSKPCLASKTLVKQHKLATSKISKSVLDFKGSKLSLKLPSNKIASYNIIVIDYLNYYKLNVDISTPSIKIFPSLASNIRKRDKVIVDFPAPVLPTTPIFS